MSTAIMLDEKGDALADKPQGAIADSGQIEDAAEVKIKFSDGPHKDHIAEYRTAKFNCGAYSEIVTCQCGAEHYNAMNACWQQGHQREESGDRELIPNFPY